MCGASAAVMASMGLPCAMNIDGIRSGVVGSASIAAFQSERSVGKVEVDIAVVETERPRPRDDRKEGSLV